MARQWNDLLLSVPVAVAIPSPPALAETRSPHPAGSPLLWSRSPHLAGPSRPLTKSRFCLPKKLSSLNAVSRIWSPARLISQPGPEGYLWQGEYLRSISG